MVRKKRVAFAPEESREASTGIAALIGSDVTSDRHWQQTVRRAKQILVLVRDDAPFTVPKGAAELYNTYFAGEGYVAEAGTFRPSQLPEKALVLLHPTLIGFLDRRGPGPWASAIEVARGRDVDRVLAGPRTRSFYNNVFAPDDPRFVTIDTAMYEILLGDDELDFGEEGVMTPQEWKARHPGESIGRAIQSMLPPEGTPDGDAQSPGVGGYREMVEVVKKVAAEQGIRPNQSQAIMREYFNRNMKTP